jgi:AraC-like DNA-binding protein
MKLEIEVPEVRRISPQFVSLIEALARRVPLKAEEAAGMVYMSVRTLRREFPKVTGMTFQHAKSYYPIQFAAAVLRTQRRPDIAAVASQLNWDPLEFGKKFKKIMKVSPRQYWKVRVGRNHPDLADFHR